LIKKLAPRYNILLRDDKSFPLIRVTGDHAFPRVLKHRGSREKSGEYFGPFASVWAVNQTLTVLQRAFLLRTCSDSIFSARTRPCLLYQIKRCSGPCVDRISESDYGNLVGEARAFLRGNRTSIQDSLRDRMQAASDALEFEKAAVLRDRIRALASIQAHQDIVLPSLGDADLVAAYQEGGQTCIQVFFFRGGANFGNRAYYPSHAKEAELGAVMEAFIGQFYANKPPPKRLLLSDPVPEPVVLSDALAVRAGHAVQVSVPRRGDKRKLIDHARDNAREALGRRLAENASQRRLLEALADTLGLDAAPERIEVYDNSHVSGTNAVGAMIVAGKEGFTKNAYRKFNIRRTHGPSDGDDYAMMREMLSRRFARALKEEAENQESEAKWAFPDLVIIDGGKGQLNAVAEVFADLGIEDVALIAVSKGPDRNAGRERIHLADGRTLDLPARDPVLYFIQRLRDESHRFAIGSHRTRRGKAVEKSTLDRVPGVGGKRKKALLHHFGSARGVAAAGLSDLVMVEGISQSLAKKIYDHFHGGG
ncbi:MAG: excinuclease ABC subunit UvrC, partial [Magnetospiraceae bacterium]